MEEIPKPTLAELEAFFATATLPDGFIISSGDIIHTKADVKKFVDSHLRVIKANPGSRANDPFYDRLVKLKDFIQNQ